MQCTNKVSQFTNNVTQNHVCIFKCAIIKFKKYVRYITADFQFPFFICFSFLSILCAITKTYHVYKNDVKFSANTK